MTTSMLRKLSPASVTVIIILLVAAGGYLSWMSVVDDICDDLWYNIYFPSAEEALATGVSFYPSSPRVITTLCDAVASFWHHCFEWNNARLANGLMFVSRLLPLWAVDILHTIMYLLMITLTVKLTAGSLRQRPLAVATAIVALWIILPWWDMKASSDYMFNYVWSSALVLSTLYVSRLAGQGRLSTPAMVGAVALALVTGAMHEGFSVPLSVGFGVTTVMEWIIARVNHTSIFKRVTARQLIIYGAFMIGTLWLFSFPAVYSRMGKEFDKGTLSLMAYLGPYIICTVFLWLTPIVFIIGSLRRPLRESLEILRDNMTLIAAAVTGYCIAVIIYLPISARMLWMALLMSTLMLLKMAFTLPLFAPGRRGGTAIAIVMTACLALFLTDLTVTQQRLYREHETVRNEFSKHPDDMLVFADVSAPEDVNWWVHDIATGIYHADTWMLVSLSSHVRDDGERIVILPLSAKGHALDELPAIDGNASMHLAYPYVWSKKRRKDKEIFSFTFAERADAGLSVRYNPYSIFRPFMRPRFDGTTVKDNTPMSYTIPVPVTRSIAESLKIEPGVDSLYFYLLPFNKKTLMGLYPVRIDTLPSAPVVKARP